MTEIATDEEVEVWSATAKLPITLRLIARIHAETEARKAAEDLARSIRACTINEIASFGWLTARQQETILALSPKTGEKP